MKSTIHACPNCHAAWSGNPLGAVKCPECDTLLVSLNLTKESWDQMGIEEKEQKKSETFKQIMDKPEKMHYLSQEYYLGRIAKDVRVIKYILLCVVLFWTFLFFIGLSN